MKRYKFTTEFKVHSSQTVSSQVSNKFFQKKLFFSVTAPASTAPSRKPQPRSRRPEASHPSHREGRVDLRSARIYSAEAVWLMKLCVVKWHHIQSAGSLPDTCMSDMDQFALMLYSTTFSRLINPFSHIINFLVEQAAGYRPVPCSYCLCLWEIVDPFLFLYHNILIVLYSSCHIIMLS